MDTTNSLKNLVVHLHEKEVGKVSPEPKIISTDKKMDIKDLMMRRQRI